MKFTILSIRIGMFSLLSVVAAYCGKNDLKVGFLVQPLYSLDFFSEQSTFELHRARTDFEIEKEIGQVRVSSQLELDFADAQRGEMLKDAFLKLNVSPWLKLKFGRFKIPFGFTSTKKSQKLHTIWRTDLTDYLRNELLIAGRSEGAAIEGGVTELIDYAIGVFTYGGNHVDKLELLTIVEHLVASVKVHPFDWADLSYSLSIPQMGYTLVSGENRYNRYFFHDIGLDVHIGDRYQGEFECFLGPDTAASKEFYSFLEDYKEMVCQGFSVSNTVYFTIAKGMNVGASALFEYLNGLVYKDFQYENRTTYFVGGLAVKIYPAKNVYIDIAGDLRFNDAMVNNRHGRFAVQVSFAPHWKLK